MRETNEANMQILQGREALESRLALRLMPAERAGDIPAGAPCEGLLDLVLTCRLDLSGESGDGALASAPVTEDIVRALGSPAEEILELSKRAAPARDPLSVRYMEEVISELEGAAGTGEEGSSRVPAARMLVITTRSGLYGAAAIVYPGALEQAAEMLGSDLIILPSSVHEVIAVPDDGSRDVTALREMVRSINESVVPPADRLSGSVYLYRRGAGLELA